MKKTNTICITSNVDLDEIRYQLQSYLTTKELVQFAFDLSYDFSDEETYVKLLRNKLNKLKFDE